MGSGWRLLLAGVFLFTAQTLHAGVVGSLKILSAEGHETILTEEQLLSLPASRIVTSTAWTEGPHLFEGISLGKVLEAAGIDVNAHPDAVIRAVALNDYEVEFPLEDIIRYNVLVAAYMDGDRLHVSDKGPYWVVYPRDDFKELRDSRFDHRWSWQLKEVQIR